MFKELAVKAFKFIGATAGVLLTVYGLGWSAAFGLHTLFKTERTEAQAFVEGRIALTENKWMTVREADLAGIHGKMDILIKQTNLIISQNYRTRKAIESQNDNP